ncbi:RnaseH-domain-containing protein [Trametes sanguinea]|nr:RnaseH-domain-containing protein [Trametes sanguinea]
MHIVSDSKYVIDGLTKHLENWERRGWIGIANSNAFRELVAHLRSRSAPVTLRWVKGHSNDLGNEGADALAGRGADMPRQFRPTSLPCPARFLQSGAALRYATQSLLYKGIRLASMKEQRKRTGLRVQAALAGAERTSGLRYRAASVWKSLRKDPVEKKVRDFLWKTLHDVHRVGPYWSNIPGYEHRALCTLCGVEETMEHILTVCKAAETQVMWKLASAFLRKRDIVIPELPCLATYLTAAVAEVTDAEGKQKRGSTRLRRLVLTETAYAIWRLRCQRTIEWAEQPGREHAVRAVYNMWRSTMNKRLRDDQKQALMRAGRTKKTVTSDTLRITWTNLIQDEISLGEEWVNEPGVLVGMPVSLADMIADHG